MQFYLLKDTPLILVIDNCISTLNETILKVRIRVTCHENRVYYSSKPLQKAQPYLKKKYKIQINSK